MLDVRALHVQYGDLVALRSVSFSLTAGTLLGCLGPNGAGKSTLMKAVLGILSPTGGITYIGGYESSRECIESRREVGYVPESARLYDSLTPAEYFAFIRDVRGLEQTKCSRTLDALAAELQLGNVMDRPIDTLSKGTRQKVVIIGALVHEPRLLLLDEPTDGLDAHAILAFHDRLRRMLKDGVAVLYCSHAIDLVERLCPEVMILHKGEVLLRDPMLSVLEKHGGPSRTLEAAFRKLTGMVNDDAV